MPKRVGRELAEQLCAMIDGLNTDEVMPALWTTVIEATSGVVDSPEAAEALIRDFAERSIPIARKRVVELNESERAPRRVH